MSRIDNRRMYLFLLVLTVASAASFQGWRTLINNFVVEVGGLDGFQYGVVQSLREVPGFLALVVIYLLLFIKEHRLAALSVAVLGMGVALTGYLPTFSGIAFTTVLMSFGFHYYETLNQSLTLQYFDRNEAPLVFGRLRGVMSATNLVVGGAVFLLSMVLEYKAMFALLGGVAVLAGFWSLTRNPTDRNLAPQTKKMVFRSRYWLFYVLTLLAGTRRQIFTVFAVYLLVAKFGYSVQAVTGLFVFNNVINMFFAPWLGKAVVRYGERWILSVEYLGLFFVFTCYAFTTSPWVAGALYVVDHLLFNFSMAIRTYFQKIADPADIAPSMAVGFTINHIAAVVVPAVGGALWLLHYSWVFLGAAGLSLCSLAMVQFIRVRNESA